MNTIEKTLESEKDLRDVDSKLLAYLQNLRKENVTTFNKDLFTKRLYEVTKEHKQKEIAEKLNKKPPTVSRWLNGETLPTIEDLVIIAKEYNCSVDYLLGIENNTSGDTSIKELCQWFMNILENFGGACEFDDGDNESASINFDCSVEKLSNWPGEIFTERPSDEALKGAAREYAKKRVFIDFINSYYHIASSSIREPIFSTVIRSLLNEIEDNYMFCYEMYLGAVRVAWDKYESSSLSSAPSEHKRKSKKTDDASTQDKEEG